MRDVLTIPALLLSIAIGVWLLAASSLLELDGPARLSHIVAGPIAASLATVALWPVARLWVRVNILLGAWLVVAPLLFDHGGWWWESIAAGSALAALALVPPSRAHQFGGGWASIFRPARDLPSANGSAQD